MYSGDEYYDDDITSGPWIGDGWYDDDIEFDDSDLDQGDFE